MNRAKLLALLKSLGYTGDDDLAKVKAWLATQNIELKTAAGAVISVDDAWATKAVTVVQDDEDKSTKAEEKADADDDEDTEGKSLKDTKVGGKGFQLSPASADANRQPPTLNGMTPLNHKRIQFRKAYDFRAKNGSAAFVDSEQAEGFRAWVRLTSSRLHNQGYASKAYDREFLVKVGVEYINSSGGALVPDEYMAQLIYLTEQKGAARKLANVVRMNSDVGVFKRKTGIAAMTPVGEAAAITAADNSYDNVELVARKWGVLMRFSRELMEDSSLNLADDAASSIAESQAAAEDNAYFLGDGSATYNGVLGLKTGLRSGAYVSATGSGWSAMVPSDFTNLLGVVENVVSGRLKWAGSRQFFYQVFAKNTVGVATYTGGNTTDNIAAGMDMSRGYLGVPYVEAEQMPITTAGSELPSVYLGDFVGHSMLGDRRMLEIVSSDQRYFDTDEIAIRGTSRFAINIHGDGKTGTYGGIVAATST